MYCIVVIRFTQLTRHGTNWCTNKICLYYCYYVYTYPLGTFTSFYILIRLVCVQLLTRIEKYFHIFFSLIRLAVLNFGEENDSDQYKHQPRIHFIKSMSREVRYWGGVKSCEETLHDYIMLKIFYATLTKYHLRILTKWPY